MTKNKSKHANTARPRPGSRLDVYEPVNKDLATLELQSTYDDEDLTLTRVNELVKFSIKGGDVGTAVLQCEDGDDDPFGLID